MSYYTTFSPQIIQENWLTYCSMEKKYLRDKLGVQFLDFLCPNIPYFLWTEYIGKIQFYLI